MKTRLNVILDRELWRKYKMVCLERDVVPSHEIVKFIKKETNKHQKGDSE